MSLSSCPQSKKRKRKTDHKKICQNDIQSSGGYPEPYSSAVFHLSCLQLGFENNSVGLVLQNDHAVFCSIQSWQVCDQGNFVTEKTRISNIISTVRKELLLRKGGHICPAFQRASYFPWTCDSKKSISSSLWFFPFYKNGETQKMCECVCVGGCGCGRGYNVSQSHPVSSCWKPSSSSLCSAREDSRSR